MSAYVHHRVPLMVEVELSTRVVLAVHVVDEAIDGPFDVRDDRVEGRKHERAIEGAGTAMWPGWTAGF